MIEQRDEWRAAVRTWRETHPTTLPSDLEDLRREFVQRFPPDRLADISLESYALGLGNSKNSFCYWLERKTDQLGSIRGGSAAKFGLWYSQAGWRFNKAYADEHQALNAMTQGIRQLVVAVEANQFDQLDDIGAKLLGLQRYSMRAKPLYMYFPDRFLPIANPEHLAHFIRVLGGEPAMGLHGRNQQLLQLLRAQPEFEGFDTWGMMRALYELYPPKQPTTAANSAEADMDSPGEPDESTEPPAILKPLLDIVERTSNVLLHGPPGTGKTWMLNHFSTYFLLERNESRTQADAYWQALEAGDSPRLAEFRVLVQPYLEFVTFHQSYSYEEFVEGLRPTLSEGTTGSVHYAVLPGVFSPHMYQSKR